MAVFGQLFGKEYKQKAEQLEQSVKTLEGRLYHLQDVNERLTYMVRALTQGIFTVDPDGIIDFWSHGMESMLAIPYEEALGKKYTHFFPKIVELQTNPISDVITGKRKITIEIQQPFKLKKDSEEGSQAMRFLELSFLPLQNEMSNLIGIVIELRDLTEKKRFAEMQLDFVSVVTHELRTPATSIKGYLSLLLDEGTNLTEDQKKFLRRAYISNERQIHTIESLFTVSKIERNSFQAELEEVQIEPIIADITQYVREDAQAKKLELRMNYPQFALPKVYADPSFVRQVVYALLTNAIKYTDQGWIEVGFTDDTNMVTVHVKDTGPGINEDIKGKLFERFVRGERPLTEQTQGIGLGLYTAKAMVEKMNGKIWLESEEGTGSTFFFSLPVMSAS